MKRKFLILLAISFFVSQSAFCGILGNTMLVEVYYPVIGDVVYNNSFEVIVSNEIELVSIPGYEFDINIQDSSILFTGFDKAVQGESKQFADAQFHGFYFFDIYETLPAFSSVLLDPATVMDGLDQSRISYDDNSIYINFAGLYATQESYVQLNIELVPEPCTLLLFGFGGFVLRRRGGRRVIAS